MKVIDASSLAKLVNREEGWEAVVDILRDGCYTVDLAVKEVLNSIWKRVIWGELDSDMGERLASSFLENLMVKLESQEPLYLDAYKLAVGHGITVYDALYIVLAKRLGAVLVTSDKVQGEASKKAGIEVVLI